MSGNYKKEDLRIIKTNNSIQTAFIRLLSQKKFFSITVNDICDEALISRSAFYMHYKDKYDLLEAWLFGLISNDIQEEEILNLIDYYVYNSPNILENIIIDAEAEVLEIFYRFVAKIIHSLGDQSKRDATDDEYTLICDFCVGGIVRLLSQQVKLNPSPDKGKTMDFFSMLIKSIIDWSIFGSMETKE